MDIDKVATLARLNLTEEEKVQFKTQMDSILSYFNELNEVDTSGIEPMVTPVEVGQKLRDDKPVVWENIDQVMENAPEVKGNLFQVPPVV